MRFATAATLLASLLCGGGCSSSSRTVVVGGERVMFYRAGTSVPAVAADANTNGWWSLTSAELDALLNP